MSKKSIIVGLFVVLVVVVLGFVLSGGEKEEVESASAVVGNVSMLEGESEIKRLKEVLEGKKELDIENKDIVSTKDDTKMQISFFDETLVTLGSLTTFEVEEYLEEEKSAKATLFVVKGAFRVVTGKIGKLAPENFTLKTKNAQIGIRGTVFAGEVGYDGSDEDYISCEDGEVVVRSFRGSEEVVLKKGEMAQVSPNGDIKKSQIDEEIFSLLEQKFSKELENLADEPITPQAYIQELIDSKAKVVYKGSAVGAYTHTSSEQKGEDSSITSGDLRNDEVVLEIDFGTKSGKMKIGKLSGEVVEMSYGSSFSMKQPKFVEKKIDDIVMDEVMINSSPMLFVHFHYAKEEETSPKKTITFNGRFVKEKADGFVGELKFGTGEDDAAENFYMLNLSLIKE